MSRIVDFHTHILPGIDDGSENIQQSLRMLTDLHRQGVTDVVLTPHYMSDRMELAAFTAKRDAAYQSLMEHQSEIPVSVYVASETWFSPALFNNDDLLPLCVENTRNLLVEFNWEDPFAEKTISRIVRLIDHFDIHPILVHADRYHNLSDKQMERLIREGCRIQINLSALTEGFSLRRRVLRWIQNGWVAALGTDCHNLTTRPPLYEEGYQVIRNKCGDMAGKMQSTMTSLLQNDVQQQDTFPFIW